VSERSLTVPRQRQRILVTGGCGFIGANLLPLLAELGHELRVLDDLSVGSSDALHTLPVDLRVGDVRDMGAVRAAVQGVDGVVHLAAHASVIDSQADPMLDFEVNALGTLNVLLACRDLGVQRFVFASSNAPIGETAPPVDECKPARPMSPYGASKLTGEGYCTAFYGSYGVSAVALRFANVYGPRSSHKSSVVARFIKDAMESGQLTIYGDGRQTRDFIHVHDLCRAIIKALEADVGGIVMHIGTGCETRILALAEMVQALIPERDVRIVHAPKRAGEILRNYSRIDLARKELGWQPAVALRDGLAETVEWFRRQ